MKNSEFQTYKQLKVIIFIATFCIYGLCSCSDDTCFKGAGKIANQTNLTSQFNTIQIEGIFNIELIQDTSYFIKLYGGSNLLEQTQIEVVDSVAICNNFSKCAVFKNHEKVFLQIHFKNLSNIIINEACLLISKNPITCNLAIQMNANLAEINLNLNNNIFTFNTEGKAGGKFTFNGKSNICKLTAQYVSQIDARNLQVKNLTITNGSIQNFYVQATDTLIAKTTKTGCIFYLGNPRYIDATKANDLLTKMK